MFHITGDELLYKNRVVALLRPMALGFRRDLEDTLTDYTTASDFEDEHREALKSEYDQGFEAGQDDERQESKNQIEAAKAEIENEAFARGHGQGIKDSEHAADAARVESLLLALQEIHNALLPLYLGFEEPEKFKRRPAKVSEIKSAAKHCCAEARLALNNFRAT